MASAIVMVPASTAQRQRSKGLARRRLSLFITGQQARNLLGALDFAEARGLQLNAAIDIFWLMFRGMTDDRTRIARCQERLSKWCKRQGFPLTWVWVREIGNHGGSHGHILMHVPPWLMENGEFQTALERALEPEGGLSHENAVNVTRAYYPRGKLFYMLKGLQLKEARTFGVRASSQGEIEGKRCGTTENIGKSARRKWLASSSTTSEVSLSEAKIVTTANSVLNDREIELDATPSGRA